MHQKPQLFKVSEFLCSDRPLTPTSHRNATDLSGLVRHKKKPAEAEATVTPAVTNGKRKAEDDAEEPEAAKKAKVEPTAATVEDAPEA